MIAAFDAAVSYAKRGWLIVPLHTGIPGDEHGCSCNRKDCLDRGTQGKHPRTENGLKDATCNEEIVRKWWSMWPDANVGLVCGAASGVVALDVDPRHGGDYSLAGMVETNGPLPPTLKAITGGGGEHYLFKHPEGRNVRPKSALFEGIDFRGEGSYVVIEPSLHVSGGRYAWDVDPDAVDTLADMPGWLIDMVERTPAPSVNGDADIGDVRDGSRNETLFRYAGRMRRTGVSPTAILAMLEVINEEHCRPPLEQAELEYIAKGVGRYQPSAPVDAAPRPQITITGLEDSALLFDARRALHQMGRGLIYHMGRRAAVKDGDIRQFAKGEVYDLLAQSARWTRLDDRGNTKTCPVPPRIIPPIMESPGRPIPIIETVAHVPCFRADLKLRTEPGIEGSTLYLGKAAEINNVPTVAAAVEVLDDWLGEFRFTDGASKAHALGLLLTLMLRPAIEGRVPIFMIEAATPGTGKSMLAEVVMLAAFGRVFPVALPAEGVEELGKRVAGWAIAGRPVVYLDNMRRISGGMSGVLSALATTGQVEVREMRELRAAGGRFDGVMILTGNNIRLDDELPRRICRVRMDSPEDPYAQKYARPDLAAWTLAHRARILGAVLTIVRTWEALGSPAGKRIRPGFLGWSLTVGGLMDHAGVGADFLDPDEVADMGSFDETTDEFLRLMTALGESGRGPWTTAEALAVLMEAEATPSSVVEVENRSAHSMAIRLGYYLKRNRGRVVEGLRLHGERDTHTKALVWRLDETAVT